MLLPLLLAAATPAGAEPGPDAESSGSAPCPKDGITAEPGPPAAPRTDGPADSCQAESPEEPAAEAPAAEASPQGADQAQDSEEASLAAAAQNPIASLISVPFQNNTTFGLNRPGLFDTQNGGLSDRFQFDAEDLDPGKQKPGRLRRTIRRLSNYEDETLNVLNIQPVIPVPLSDDLTLVTRTILPVVSKPTVLQGQVWGLGPTFQIPTASDDVLGTGKWSAGPAAVAVYSKGPWVAGGLASQIWSFAGDSDRGM